MWFFKTLLSLCVLLVIAEAREKHECEIKFNVTDADWGLMKKGVSHLSDNLACFMKCALEKDGIVDSEGKLSIEKFSVDVDKWVQLTEKEKTNTKNCLKSTAPVKTCADIQPIYLCIANSDK